MDRLELKGIVESTKALRIAITYDCPLNCHACYSKKNRDTTRMDGTFYEKLLVEGKELGFNTVAFGGGESLVDIPLLESFLKVAKEHGYDTSITSSGYRLNPALLSRLVRAGLDFFQLSLGFNRVTFPDKLDLLQRSGATFGVNFLVEKDKVSELPSIHENFKERGASYVVYIMPKSMRPETNDLKFNKENVMEYLDTLTSIKKNSELPFLVGCTTGLFVGEECSGTGKGISVSPDGNISFCAFCEKWIPYTNSLKETMEILERLHSGDCLCLGKFITVDA